MLWQRIATAVVLIPVTLWLLIAAPSEWVALVLFGVVVLAAGEWRRLCLPGVREQSLFGGLLLVAAGCGYLWSAVSIGILVAVSVVWLAMPWLLARFPSRTPWDHPAPLATFGALMLAACWLAIVDLHAGGAHGVLVLSLFGVIWAADIGAYFVGRAWGRRKLAPAVSPGKSIEGAIGGLVAAALVAIGLGWAPLIGAVPFAERLLVCVGVAAISIVGDLGESMLKRSRGVKDSGNLLPGHGGVLDRLDSLFAAAPVFALWWSLRAPASVV